jgi:hypothetical protein
MKKISLGVICLSLFVTVSAFGADPEDRGRGNANNPNAEWVVRAVFEEFNDFLSFGFCSFTPNKDVDLTKAYAKQGDEGIDKAFDTSLCLVLTVFPDFVGAGLPFILDEWPDEGCANESTGAPWDGDPLPFEEGCP